MNLREVTKKTKAKHGKWYSDACGTAFAMELVGERWALLIIRELMFGPRRFSDLRTSLPGISAKVLTERLAGLADAGVLVRRKLPPPAAAQVYELTQWGYRAEPLIQELGRWAAMSGAHDPTLPLSPISFMLSLRTMFDPVKAGEWRARIGFRFADVVFTGTVENGAFTVKREEPVDTDAVFSAPEASPLAAMVYLGMPASDVGVEMTGNREAARRFMTLFDLPEQIG
ncbi:transcriptional regulator [Altererythrobacter sp. HHU K3-1]|uniref:Transcriptional regulator n=2 Tax=Qipengyuania atrilutea TaxID=2744473 RepID=A0A850H9Q9_9SPHN|nr:transcriptional regulator [Actirhodobacter atriluteus]